MVTTALRLVNKPATEPLDLAYLQSHTRNFNADETDLIDVWIAAARQEAERLSGELLISQTWEFTLSEFPAGRKPILLPIKPAQSIASFTYIDTSGAEQSFGTMAGSPETAEEYVLIRDVVRPRIALTLNAQWPLAAAVENAVSIQIVAGYGTAADVPSRFKAAMALMVGHFSENREDVIVADNQTILELPNGIRALLAKPRVS